MVDVDNGYTRIANELFDAILRFPFTKRELKIVFAVVRKTYGYNKKTDALSMWQIGNTTGVGHANTSRTVADLVARNVLKRGGVGRVSHGQEIAEIGLNKNYCEWALTYAKTGPVTKQNPLQNGSQTYAKMAIPPMPKRQPQKTTTKDNTKRHTPIARFDDWYSTYPLKVGRGQAEKAFAKLSPDPDLLAKMISAVEMQKADRERKKRLGEFVPEWKHPSTWLNGKCWEDEIAEAPKAKRRPPPDLYLPTGKLNPKYEGCGYE